MKRLSAGIALFVSCGLGSVMAQIPSGAAADLVLGQEDFDSNGFPVSPDATTILNARSAAVDPTTERVFVSDSLANRALRFPSARRWRMLPRRRPSAESGVAEAR